MIILDSYDIKKYKNHDTSRMKKFENEIKKLTREAEDIVRQEKGFPKVGDGWIEETKLYYSIKEKFSSYNVIHHGRPKFLNKQHLDIWIPKLKIAIEYQGEQHNQAIDFFGGEKAYQETLRRDARKKELCKLNGVSLLYVFKNYDLNKIIEKINVIKKNVR